MLSELSTPVIPPADSLLSGVLTGLVNYYRESARQSIVNEMHAREASIYDLYYNRFATTELPPGIAATWTEHYPYTSDRIKLLLRGEPYEGGIEFGPFPPPVNPTAPIAKPDLLPKNVKKNLIIFSGIAMVTTSIVLIATSD